MCQYRPEYGQRLEMANIKFKIILEMFNKLLSHERGPAMECSFSLNFCKLRNNSERLPPT